MPRQKRSARMRTYAQPSAIGWEVDKARPDSIIAAVSESACAPTYRVHARSTASRFDGKFTTAETIQMASLPLRHMPEAARSQLGEFEVTNKREVAILSGAARWRVLLVPMFGPAKREAWLGSYDVE